MRRESWSSRLGFILAVAGSAIGLANIWRFPYIVGKHGGAAFIIIYLLCLAFMGFPVFISELLIGRTAQSSPTGAFRKLGGPRFWPRAGSLTILTGFIVSSFYSAVAGWILGYLIEAAVGNLVNFHNTDQATIHFNNLISSPTWSLAFHFLFIFLSTLILFFGVREGIERSNKLMVPFLIVILLILVVNGFTLPHAAESIVFLFSPDWSVLTPTAVIVAMGQAFFTLSLGQGTLVTYGSYLKKQENLITSSFPVVILDTLVSVFSAIAVFTIVFAAGMEPDSGPGLIFHTLPWAFSQLTGGYFLGLLFFLLVVLAALTSEISAMEPTVAYLIDERGWNRKPAVFACGFGAFLLGIPSALSYNLLRNYTFHGHTFLEFLDFFCSSILIPIGGLLAIILVGWRWKFQHAFTELKRGTGELFERHPWLKSYFWLCIKYTAPVLILLVFLNAMVS